MLVSLVIITLLFVYRYYNPGPYIKDNQLVSNAFVESFSITGIMYLLFSGMIYLSNERAMSALTYGLKQLFRVFKRNTEDNITYHEYIAQGKEEKTFSIYFIIGFIELVIGLLIYFIFMT
ncbi:MAG: DUF3899 domain-containing protein [Candidatus Phytoplasma sp.]|nr:DUF3899 domain-containing protein [Phytoplasma sp.]